MICRQFVSFRVFGTKIIRTLNTSCVKSNETRTHGSVDQFSENFNNHNGNDEHKIDEPQHEYIHTTNLQRLILSVGSSVAALVNPHR